MRCLSVANETTNYKLPKPEADDFYDISEYNKTMDLLDESLTELDKKKLDKNGDASEVITEYEQEVLKENIESGETLSVTHGKIKKWFSEMKDVAFSGKAKDVTPDAAHRFVTDTEKNDWNGKVSASGGDISETVIGALETIDTKYPVPDAGEKVKSFFGKFITFMKNIKPLEADITVYVATTGSDIAGDGSKTAPFKTITYALSKIPKTLNGCTASVVVASGIYAEGIIIRGYSGNLKLLLSGNITVNCIEVDNSKIVCESFNGEIYTITTGYVYVHNNSKWFSFAQINIVTTSYFTRGKSASIFGSENSVIYMSGTVTMTGNTDVAIDLIVASVGQFGILEGTGFNLAINSQSGSKISYTQNNIVATALMNNYTTGGILVNPYGARIGTLPQNITIYVATTGSDGTGDGTSVNPYKTIQQALDMLPKDLGGFTATITIANGTYTEELRINAFYNGVLNIYGPVVTSLTDINCKIKGQINATNCFYISTKYLEIVNSGSASVNISRCVEADIQYIIANNASADPGIALTNVKKFAVDQTQISNRNIGINISNSVGWIAAISGSNNIIGINSEWSSRVTVVQNISIGSTRDQYTGNYGGQFIQPNGSQITGIISSGISCTWGTIQGGYVRHGNLKVAMVTLQFQVAITTALSANNTYQINGFPPPSGAVAIAVPVHQPGNINWAQINNGTNTVSINLRTNLAVGTTLNFNATYLTVS